MEGILDHLVHDLVGGNCLAEFSCQRGFSIQVLTQGEESKYQIVCLRLFAWLCSELVQLGQIASCLEAGSQTEGQYSR